MTNTTEDIAKLAKRLNEFAEDVQRQRPDPLVNPEYYYGERPTKDWTLVIYERCLGRLNKEDRIKFDSILDQMENLLAEPRD